jgi:hypothetical protein
MQARKALPILLGLVALLATGAKQDIDGVAKHVTYIRSSTQKICQVTGDYDRERRQQTKNLTESRYGVSGTDLGFSFEHQGKTVFLFGDTHGRAKFYGADSIAFSTDISLDQCLNLKFNTGTDNNFLPPHVPGVSLGYFEVPSSGFSANGKMYVFFMTDHPRPESPGRAVLATSDDDARTFSPVYDASQSKFINLSPVVVNNADIPGLPMSQGQGVLLWGSGQYRRSDPYLAYVPLNSVEDRRAWRFFSGLDNGLPRWSENEADAVPLFDHPCVGEFSVQRNPFLNKWVMLYNCDRPRGINFRVSDNPWGAWSATQLLFHPISDNGYCSFIHTSYRQRVCDFVSDFGRELDWGGEYAPHMIPRLPRVTRLIRPSTT